MKTRTAELTAVAAIAIAAAVLATPWVIAATSTASTTATSSNPSAPVPSNSMGTRSFVPRQHGWGFGPGQDRSNGPLSPGYGLQSTANLTVGQTITVTSTKGEFQTIGSPSSNGTASGTVTFTVTSRLDEGYTLSITGGSLVVGGTAYTISSGAAQMGRAADVISGQGATTPAGQFLLQGLARGSFAGSTARLLLDFKTGSAEYAVALTGNVQS
ncbi:MAG TPA: hypothetical protein VEC02_00235 [Nitrososphaerales archaeon]|nr:hypothetical protein [Nitrososphaerales archaeon]